MRQLPERKIGEILQEVQELSQDSNQDAESQFGPPAVYAGQFARGESRSRATRTAIMILTAGIAILGVDLLMWIIRDERLEVGSVRVFYILIGVQLAAIVGAVIADHRLPSGFRLTQGQRR